MKAKKSYKKYKDGGKVDPEKKLSVFEAAEILKKKRKKDREEAAKFNERKSSREKEIESRNKPSGVTQGGLRDGRSAFTSERNYEADKARRAENQEINRDAAKRQFFTEEVTGKSFKPGSFHPKTEMERAKAVASKKKIENNKKFQKSVSDIKSYKKGGMLGKKKALDFNKDGKISKADFILMAKAKAKKK